MNRVLRFLVFIICCGVSISCEEDSVELKERFKLEAQARWLNGPTIYFWYSPGFSVSRDCRLPEQSFYKWQGLQIAAGRGNDSQQLRVAYLDEMIRKPEQLRIRVTPDNYVSRSPSSSVQAQLEDRLDYCTERYINQCIKSGKYWEYLSSWDAISNNRVASVTFFHSFSYSDVSIVSLDIVSSEAFFKQRPGASLSPFFQVVLFPSTDYLVDGDGNFVEDGPKGGMWYDDLNVQTEDDEYVFMKVDEFVSYRSRIIPFALQMAKAPTEHPSSAEFTVTISYSDGTECSSSLTVDFPY